MASTDLNRTMTKRIGELPRLLSHGAGNMRCPCPRIGCSGNLPRYAGLANLSYKAYMFLSIGFPSFSLGVGRSLSH